MTVKNLAKIIGMFAILISPPSLASTNASSMEMARLSQVVMIEASLRCFDRHGVSKQNQADFVRGALSLEVAGTVLLSENQWLKARNSKSIYSLASDYINKNGGCYDIAQRYKDWLKTHDRQVPLRGEDENTPFPL